MLFAFRIRRRFTWARSSASLAPSRRGMLLARSQDLTLDICAVVAVISASDIRALVRSERRAVDSTVTRGNITTNTVRAKAHVVPNTATKIARCRQHCNEKRTSSATLGRKLHVVGTLQRKAHVVGNTRTKIARRRQHCNEKRTSSATLQEPKAHVVPNTATKNCTSSATLQREAHVVANTCRRWAGGSRLGAPGRSAYAPRPRRFWQHQPRCGHCRF